MRHKPFRFVGASTAICAVLALASTLASPGAAAQDAAVLPGDAPSAAAAEPPTIVLPPAASEPSVAPIATSLPVVQPVPPITLPAAEMPAEEAVAKPATAVATRSETRRDPPASKDRAPEVQVAEIGEAMPALPSPVSNPVSVASAAEPVAEAPAASGVVATDREKPAAPNGMVAALLIALGLGTGGYLAARTRRRPADREKAPVPVHAADPQPERGREPVPGAVAPAASPFPPAPPALEPQAAQPFVLPAGPVPQTRAQRDALLERMISAPPDAANPFTSRKARLRRARIILQSREIDEMRNASQPFDWRTYEPPAGQPAPAMPPRVMA